MTTPKVSVVIPCYNTQKYLRQCLDSVVNQTLRDIQIICVDDGSTDNTPLILAEYAGKDPRIKIITKSNTGYGDSMNCGFDAAEGEYLGIVESDDFAEPDMFERLYKTAVEHKLDVCKAGFFQYSTVPEIKNVPILTEVKLAGNKVFCPATDFAKPRRQAQFFAATAAIWAAIYSREFLRSNHIRFNPTPGASYQDVSFCFKVWTKARRVQFLNCCLLHYRVDNALSSVHNPGKVYCVCDEFEEVERFVREDSTLWKQLAPIMVYAKYTSYNWNYERLSGEPQAMFLKRFYDEFCQHRQDGKLERPLFPWYCWNDLQMLLLDPDRYHDIQSRKLAGEPTEDFYDAYPEHRPIKGKILYYLAENISGASYYVSEFGFVAMVNVFVNKVKNRIVFHDTKSKV